MDNSLNVDIVTGALGYAVKYKGLDAMFVFCHRNFECLLLNLCTKAKRIESCPGNAYLFLLFHIFYRESALVLP